MSAAVTAVTVDTRPDGALAVRWVVEGEPVAVDVAVGPGPEGLDHRHALTAPAGATEAVVPARVVSAAGTARPFVSVAPHGGGPALVVADRRLPFRGISNFRDLGGYRTRSGGRTRWGRLFRADALHDLTPDDLAAYRELGVGVVVDLRGPQESAQRPNPVESVLRPLLSRPAEAPADARATLGGAATVEQGERFLVELYGAHLEHGAALLGEVVGTFAAPGGLPAVFHCHAGKDRTGVVAALVLELLGVERDDVLDDYALTARYRAPDQRQRSATRLVAQGMAPEAAAGVLASPRWAMAEALAELDRRHGGAEAYLLGPAGLGVDQLEALRSALVEPPEGAVGGR